MRSLGYQYYSVHPKCLVSTSAQHNTQYCGATEWDISFQYEIIVGHNHACPLASLLSLLQETSFPLCFLNYIMCTQHVYLLVAQGGVVCINVSFSEKQVVQVVELGLQVFG